MPKITPFLWFDDLTIIGFLVSFLTAAAGAGHGDKSLILFIFPLPALVWVLGGFVLGVVAASIQFALYAFAIHVASKRGWEWLVAGGMFLIHFGVAGVVFWLLKSA
jgi:hypothetical protein